MVTPTSTTSQTYDIGGNLVSTMVNGVITTSSTTVTTNFAAPPAATTNSLTSAGYTSGGTQTTVSSVNTVYAACGCSPLGNPMYRLTGMTDQNGTTIVNGVSYNAANQLLGMTYVNGGAETRGYNNLLQLTGITAAGVNLTYNYPAGANIGKINSMTDGIMGETVTYAYDSLNRLISAGTSSWGQGYNYDGFGNLTSKTVTLGSAPSVTVNVNSATNQLNGSDANGNYGGTFDVENRMAYTYYPSTGGGAYFGYDTQNRRVWQWDGSESTPGGNPSPFTVYFYGIDGKRLAAYTINSQYAGTQQNITGYGISVGATQQETYFGSRRLAPMDRVGSARGAGTDSGGYYPFGEDKGTAVANDSWKFGGYWRDLVTGLDFAGARYYSSTMGRFMSADPYMASATSPTDVTSPQSWNRFAYVGNDPVNYFDPRGTEPENPDRRQLNEDPTDPWDPCSGGDVPEGARSPNPFCYTPLPAPPSPAPAPSPNCGSVLTQMIQTTLHASAPALLAWDPGLAPQLVQEGSAVDIDPRLFEDIAMLESGNGTSIKGNNPFGLGPGNSYNTPLLAIQAEGATLKRFIYTWNETTVAALYTGNGYKVVPNQPWKVIQYPAYCWGGKYGQNAAMCQAAGQTISMALLAQSGNDAVKLRAGDPKTLSYPCR